MNQSNTQIIINALTAQATPNMPSGYVEDHLLQERDRLISLIHGELNDTVAGDSLLDKYLQDPITWEGALADVLIDYEVDQNPVIVETAQKVHDLVQSLQPEAAEQEESDKNLYL